MIFIKCKSYLEFDYFSEPIQRFARLNSILGNQNTYRPDILTQKFCRIDIASCESEATVGKVEGICYLDVE